MGFFRAKVSAVQAVLAQLRADPSVELLETKSQLHTIRKLGEIGKDLAAKQDEYGAGQLPSYSEWRAQLRGEEYNAAVADALARPHPAAGAGAPAALAAAASQPNGARGGGRADSDFDSASETEEDDDEPLHTTTGAPPAAAAAAPAAASAAPMVIDLEELDEQERRAAPASAGGGGDSDDDDQLKAAIAMSLNQQPARIAAQQPARIAAQQPARIAAPVDDPGVAAWLIPVDADATLLLGCWQRAAAATGSLPHGESGLPLRAGVRSRVGKKAGVEVRLADTATEAGRCVSRLHVAVEVAADGRTAVLECLSATNRVMMERASHRAGVGFEQLRVGGAAAAVGDGAWGSCTVLQQHETAELRDGDRLCLAGSKPGLAPRHRLVWEFRLAAAATPAALPAALPRQTFSRPVLQAGAAQRPRGAAGTAAAPAGRWEWGDGRGSTARWRAYSPTTAARLEAGFGAWRSASGPSRVEVDSERYVDMQAMKQCRVDNPNMTRQVRRQSPPSPAALRHVAAAPAALRSAVPSPAALRQSALAVPAPVPVASSPGPSVILHPQPALDLPAQKRAATAAAVRAAGVAAAAGPGRSSTAASHHPPKRRRASAVSGVLAAETLLQTSSDSGSDSDDDDIFSTAAPARRGAAVAAPSRPAGSRGGGSGGGGGGGGSAASAVATAIVIDDDDDAASSGGVPIAMHASATRISREVLCLKLPVRTPVRVVRCSNPGRHLP